MLRSLKHILILFAIIIFRSAPSEAEEGSLSKQQENILRQQLISFVQSGRSLEELPSSHPLYPMSEAPTLAIAAYYLMHNDTEMLQRFFPKIVPHLMAWFSTEGTTRSGLIKGSIAGGADSGIYLSPYINGLANLEIHILYLITSRAGMDIQALSYLEWSRELTGIIDRTFYNINRNFYFPLDSRGQFISVHTPRQLLPALMNESMDCTAKANIFNNCLEHLSAPGPGRIVNLYNSSTFHRRLLNSVIKEAGCGRIDSVIEMISGSSQDTGFEDDPVSSSDMSGAFLVSEKPDLFPAGLCTIGSLIHFASFLEREGIYANEEIGALSADVEALRSALAGDYNSLESFRHAILLVNRLLVTVSEINTALNTPGKLWKVVKVPEWRKISPRDRKLLMNAAESSVEDLIRAKSLLSEKLADGTGITFKVKFPPSPIRPEGRISFKASLQCTDSALDISSIYLHIGMNRWSAGDEARIGPERGGFSFSGSFTMPPGTETGVKEFPCYITFMAEGKRYEIHRKCSIILNEGFDAVLNFPEGKRIMPALPVDIVLKYETDKPCQGVLEGRFCKPLSSEPELPARFRVEKNKRVTTLPIKIIAGSSIPPGRYPFTLNLYLQGELAAAFDESIVKPFNWLHLGPLPSDDVRPGSGSDYQDDFSRSYRSGKGREVRWKRVPSGAVSEDGWIFPDRIDTEMESSCLLYTMLDIDHEIKTRMVIETGNDATLWLNGNVIYSGGGSDASTVVEKLRKGKNSILVALTWQDRILPFMFELSDLSGLPVPGAENRIDNLVSRYASTDDAPSESGALITDREPREVTLALKRNGCSSISVIGSFNNWDPEETPMKQNGDGIWEATILLEPGRYSYKFLIDNREKITDPSARMHESDGFGGTNSVLVID